MYCLLLFIDFYASLSMQFWQDKILETLSTNGNRFNIVMTKTLVGLLLVVLVKDTVYPYVKDVRAAILGVGLMGVLGNKGAVAIRMSLHDSAVCFVTAHLAAHTDNITGRNSDYNNIIQRIVFLSEYTVKDNYGYDESDLISTSGNNNSNISYSGVNTTYIDSNSNLKIGRPQRGAALTQGECTSVEVSACVCFR